jgi:hemin uptake protein HemP
MDQKLQDHEQAIAEAFAQLPASLQTAMTEVDWGTAIQHMGKKYSLSIPQLGKLDTEVLLVMLGLTDDKEFPRMLSQELNLESETVSKLVQDLNSSVFQPIQDRVMKLDKETHLPQRDDILSSIEDKKPEKKETVVHKKLADVFSVPPAKTDHSTTETPTGYADGEDPYHEPID